CEVWGVWCVCGRVDECQPWGEGPSQNAAPFPARAEGPSQIDVQRAPPMHRRHTGRADGVAAGGYEEVAGQRVLAGLPVSPVSSKDYALAQDVNHIDVREESAQRVPPAAAGQPGVVYTALEVDVVRRLDLPADVRIGRERWRVSEPDRVVDDLLVRQGCAYLLHEARHVAAPSSIGHRLMRGVVDRGDLFFV